MVHLVQSNERGVTLLELLIAMMLLATAMVGLAASFPLAVYGVATGGFQTTATLLAQQCIELAKHTPYDQLNTLPAQAECSATPAGFAGFSRAVTVAPASPTAQTTTVTVVVSFTSGSGGINDTTVATILSQ